MQQHIFRARDNDMILHLVDIVYVMIRYKERTFASIGIYAERCYWQGLAHNS